MTIYSAGTQQTLPSRTTTIGSPVRLWSMSVSRVALAIARSIAHICEITNSAGNSDLGVSTTCTATVVLSAPLGPARMTTRGGVGVGVVIVIFKPQQAQFAPQDTTPGGG